MIKWVRRKLWQIKNLYRWSKVVWNQYDFDYKYALDVFEFQLSKIADFLESDKAYSLSSEVDAQKIRTYLKLTKKVHDEEYATEYFDLIEQKYGEGCMGMNFVPTDSTEKYFTIRFAYEDYGNAEEIREEHDRLRLECRAKQEKAARLMWEFLKHNLYRWWS